MSARSENLKFAVSDETFKTLRICSLHFKESDIEIALSGKKKCTFRLLSDYL